ncbi:MAG TPA: hypothetical protein GX506_05585 [Firmicutes bacterium]|nr:hypothetical protein [Bacillota bacterium]
MGRKEVRVLNISPRSFVRGATCADEAYARLDARYNCMAPDKGWVERARYLEAEVRSARMDVKFDNN